MRKFVSMIGTGLLIASLASPVIAARPTSPADQKICFRYTETTGSRINRLDCRTKSEWANIGVDVDEVMKDSPRR